jgi:monothiol glutaredoxin
MPVPMTQGALATRAQFHPEIVAEVQSAVEREPVVVVGMGWNPHVKRARACLDEKGVRYVYLGYGNYLTGWKPRLALKLWAAWPTFPMVFVNGTLVGGATDLKKAMADGTFEPLLASPRAG